MRINWKLRLKNKTTLIALIAALVALIYQILGILGVLPSVSEAQIIEMFGMIVNLLAVFGIITDPTTAGLNDSDQALQYNQPKEEEHKEGA